VSRCRRTAANVSVRDARRALHQAGGVLAPNGVAVRVDGADGLQHLDLVVADELGVPEGRRFHRRERHHLQQVVLHHVAQRADAVVVA
jgi:hypothetical protein